MRTKSPADHLFPKARKQILSALLMSRRREWFLSDLARHLRAPKTSLQREITNLERAGILQRRSEGRHVYFRANPDCPFLPELRGLLAKTAGLVDVIREALAPLERRITTAFIYGSVARAAEVADSDIDLMVIGAVGLSDLALPLRRASERLGRDVNPTVLAVEDLGSRAGRSGFVRSVLKGPKLFVVGDRDVLEGAAGATARRA